MQSFSVMVESIGKKLVQARLARGLTLEEAAMETRIRARQLGALEADDYSSFANNTYARGFLLMYGKFLNVDVRAVARELEAGSPISLADYQYLNAASEPAAERPVRRMSPEIRRTERGRPSLAPLIVFVVLMSVVGFGAHLYYQAQRLDVGNSNRLATPAPDASPGPESKTEAAPASTAVVPATNPHPSPSVSPTTAPPTQPLVPAASPSAPLSPSSTISDRQFLSTAASSAPQSNAVSPAPTAVPPITTTLAEPVNELVVEPLKKTWIRIRRDDPAAEPIFEDVLYPKVGPLKLKGNRFWVEVKDADAVMLRKNGQPLAYQPPGITIQ
jgi:cytoskeletal protein RodZ